MTVGGNELDMVAVVNRRLDVLKALAEPRHKRELVEQLDLSRSTVDRAMRELETLGLVARGDGYHLTVTGHLVVDLFRGLLADLDDVAAARELLAELPRDAPMNPAMLRGATVQVAEHPSPTAALDTVVEAVDRAERIRGFSVAETRPDLSERTAEAILDEGTEVELLFRPAVLDHLEEGVPDFGTVLGRENFQPYVHPGLPFGLIIASEPAGQTTILVVYDDDWSFRGVVVNDSPDAFLWAKDLFASYREAADPLDPGA